MKKIMISLVSLGILGSIASITSGELVTALSRLKNRKVITESQLREAENNCLQLVKAETAEKRRNVLDILIENELIRQKAEEANILVNDEELNAALYDIKQRNNLFSDEQLKQAISTGRENLG